MAFIVEKDFEYNGHRCVVIGTEMGHRCGYVGVANGHQLFGVGYSDKKFPFSLVENEPIGKRGIIPIVCHNPDDELISMDLLFNVHGGVTFADGGNESKYPVESDLWWIGFDCGHSGDGRDFDLMKQLLSPDKYVRLMEIYRRNYDGDIVRDTEYVEQECKNLVDQIVALEKGASNVK